MNRILRNWWLVFAAINALSVPLLLLNGEFMQAAYAALVAVLSAALWVDERRHEALLDLLRTVSLELSDPSDLRRAAVARQLDDLLREAS